MVTMNSFVKYDSIENSSNHKAIEYITNHILPNVEWCALEKIHGSNFSCTVNHDEIKWGKRSSYIDDDALCQFNNSHYIKEKYDENVVQLFHSVKEINPSALSIRIFGEICGGGYTGAKSSHPKSVKKVQKQIQYSPDIEFIVFDIKVFLEDESYYLDMDLVIQLCETTGMLYVPISFRGTLEEMLNLEPKYITNIPNMFELPILDNNWSEGYVIKPINEIRKNGSRIILKHKNPDFTERYPSKSFKSNSIDTMTNDETLLIEKCYGYINQNRIDNVLSKLMENEKLNRKKVSGLVFQDALIDIMKDLNEDEKLLFKEKRSHITGTMMCYSYDQCYTLSDATP
jgi:Rnl2 family RNA ligase